MTPPMMMNAWTPSSVVRPVASSVSNGRVGPQGDAQAGADHQDVGAQDRGGAEQAELLADGGEDEVGLDLGDAGRGAEADAGAGDAAVGEGEGRLDDLEALGLGDRPRVRARSRPGRGRGRTACRRTSAPMANSDVPTVR